MIASVLKSLPRWSTKGLSAMSNSMVNRRLFNHASLVSLLAAGAGTALNDTISAQQAAVAATRRDQTGAPWRAVARYQLDRSDLSVGGRFPTASSCQWRDSIRRFRRHHL